MVYQDILEIFLQLFVHPENRKLSWFSVISVIIFEPRSTLLLNRKMQYS